MSNDMKFCMIQSKTIRNSEAKKLIAPNSVFSVCSFILSKIQKQLTLDERTETKMKEKQIIYLISKNSFFLSGFAELKFGQLA